MIKHAECKGFVTLVLRLSYVLSKDFYLYKTLHSTNRRNSTIHVIEYGSHVYISHTATNTAEL